MKKMQKGIALLLVLSLCLGLMATSVLAAVEAVELNQEEAALHVGETLTLTADENGVYWWSSDEAVATVDEDGVVTAVGPGEAMIGAEPEDSELYGAVCAITVIQSVTGVSVEATATVKTGETATLTATLEPAGASDRTVTWETSDEMVATVENGVVTGVSAGAAEITVTTWDGGFTATCLVTVVEPVYCTVTFDADGGSDVEPAEVEAGETVAEPSAPSREGYTFQGWNLDGAAYDFSKAVTEDILLIAQWEKKPAANTGNTGSSRPYTPPVTPVTPAKPAEPEVEIIEEEVPLIDFPMPFSDVTVTDWYFSDVAFVASKELIDGMGTGAYEPDTAVTRGTVVLALYRLEGSPAVAEASGFQDVPANADYADAVAWAAAQGIVLGYSQERFGPEDFVRREQLAAILYRYAAWKGSAGQGKAALDSFTDAAKVSDYAKTPMSWAVGAELIQGYNGKLNPNGLATRAQYAAILKRVCGDQ